MLDQTTVLAELAGTRPSARSTLRKVGAVVGETPMAVMMEVPAVVVAETTTGLEARRSRLTYTRQGRQFMATPGPLALNLQQISQAVAVVQEVPLRPQIRITAAMASR